MQDNRERLLIYYRLPIFALAMLAGNLLLQAQPWLDADSAGPFWTSSDITGLLPLCLLLPFVKPRQQILLVFLLGYLWALLFAQLYFQELLKDELEGQDILLEGIVSGLPSHTAHSQRFDFKVIRQLSSTSLHDSGVGTVPRRIRLSWYYTDKVINSGERWQLRVRLKQPHGMQNPGGFDYEKWLYSRGIQATGYVRKSADNRRLEAAGWGIDRLRQLIAERLDRHPGSYTGIIKALAIGDKSSIQPAQWQQLVGTGTSHLMAISGLHIGLVAGLVFWLGLKLSWLVPGGTGRISAQQKAAILSLLVAGFYALLAGFSIPTQRAFIMLLVILGATLVRRPAFGLNTLSLALMAVLLINPKSSLQPGFWLSFLAVLIIALLVKGRPAQVGSDNFAVKAGRWQQMLSLQVWIAIGMLPITIILFQQASLVSPVANLLMIPLVGFLIVPLVLISSCLLLIWPEPGGLLQLVSYLLGMGWWWLETLLTLPLASLHFKGANLITQVLAMTGLLLLLMPKGFALRLLGPVMLLPLLLNSPARPATGDVWLSVLDVGQGLSILLQTHSKSLLFDAGDKPSEGFDIGQRVIVPFLRHQGVEKLDVLLVSHGDRDHRGGAPAVLRALHVLKTMGYVVQDYLDVKPHHQPCIAGTRWQWDGVDFELLHPDKAYVKTNNQSCVLRVTGSGYSLLIPGDIERKIEKQLISAGQPLTSRVLVLAHHGSNTSTSRAWLEQTRPELAIASAGYRNRFSHPSSKVVERLEAQGSRLLKTAESGAILIRFRAGLRESLEINQQRKVRRHYWNHRF